MPLKLWTRWGRLILAGALLALGASQSVALAQGAPGGKIVFQSNRDTGDRNTHQIYEMNPDGSAIRRLTNDTFDNWFPSVSPDGSQIAFISNRDGGWNVHLMASDGSNVRRVTRERNVSYQAAWSPDGDYLAVVVNDGGHFQGKSDESPTAEIYVVAVKSGTWTRLTNDAFDDLYPSWRR